MPGGGSARVQAQPSLGGRSRRGQSGRRLGDAVDAVGIRRILGVAMGASVDASAIGSKLVRPMARGSRGVHPVRVGPSGLSRWRRGPWSPRRLHAMHSQWPSAPSGHTQEWAGAPGGSVGKVGKRSATSPSAPSRGRRALQRPSTISLSYSPIDRMPPLPRGGVWHLSSGRRGARRPRARAARGDRAPARADARPPGSGAAARPREGGRSRGGLPPRSSPRSRRTAATPSW